MIYKINPETNDVVGTYRDLKHVCSELKVDASGIRKVLNGNQVTSYGFRWTVRAPGHKIRVRSEIDAIKSSQANTRSESDYLELELEQML